MAFWPFKKKSAFGYSSVPSNSGWSIKEPFSGAWQRNIEWQRKDVLCYHAVFACTTLIASDISKLSVKMMRRDTDGIWSETNSGAAAVLDKPNVYQNRIQFIESWVLSKYIRGNTYVLKERDASKKVVGLHVLHPDLVLPIITEEGDVFYQLGADNLTGVSQSGITVPASEIIHDRFNCFYHPLVGLSPLYAAGLPAYMGIKALTNSANTFENGSRPSGILVVPEAIDKEQAAAMREAWEANYSGKNYGKTAILGGDVKYQPLSMNAEEMQLVAHLEMTAQMVCSTYHVPPYKIGVGDNPSYNNVQALNVEYYNSALQHPIESLELCLDKGLEIKEGYGIEFDVDGLLRMDTKSLIETLGMAVDKAILSPNEARKRVNEKPVDGGETPLLQQQMWPIGILANRSIEELTGGNEVAAATTEQVDQLQQRALNAENTLKQNEYVSAFVKGLNDDD